jgi:ubiquinone/menaquinone biosynthesis C-methylase UbiE
VRGDEIEERFSYYGKMLEDNLTQFARRSHDAQLLIDAGCGDLRFSGILADNTKAVVISTDIDLRSIRRGSRSRRGKNIFPIACDARKLPLRSGIADGVVVINVLHHLPTMVSLSEVLEEFRRVSRGNLRIFIKENVSNNPIRLLAERIYRVMPSGFLLSSQIVVDPYSKDPRSKLEADYHLLRFTAGQLSRTLTSHGLNVTREDRQELFLYFLYFLSRTFPFPRVLFMNQLRTDFLYRIEHLMLGHYLPSRLCQSILIEAESNDRHLQVSKAQG